MKSQDNYNRKKNIILKSASRLLAEKGYYVFSMRNVARDCKIHLKTLQYYFPTKKILIKETLDDTLSEYYAEMYLKFDNTLENTDPEKSLRIFIGFTFDIIQTRFTSRFYPEIWAMASHDNDICKFVDIIYTRHRLKLASIILAINPALSAKTIVHRSTIIATAIEAMILYVGEGKPKHKALKGLREELIKQCVLIVKSIN